MAEGEACFRWLNFLNSVEAALVTLPCFRCCPNRLLPLPGLASGRGGADDMASWPRSVEASGGPGPLQPVASNSRAAATAFPARPDLEIVLNQRHRWIVESDTAPTSSKIHPHFLPTPISIPDTGNWRTGIRIGVSVSDENIGSLSCLLHPFLGPPQDPGPPPP